VEIIWLMKLGDVEMWGFPTVGHAMKRLGEVIEIAKKASLSLSERE